MNNLKRHEICLALTDISCLYHAHVVTAVANTADALPCMLSYKPRDIGLLRRRTSTGDDSRQLRGNLNKLVLERR